MYRCLSCGHLFEDGEQGYHNENYDYWGEPFTKQEEVCPICGEPFEEVALCPICKKNYISEDEWICDDCFNENIDLSVITYFYEQTEGSLKILIEELAEYGGKDFEELISRAVNGQQAKKETLSNLAQAWVENTSNLDDYKKWLGW